VDRVEVMLAQLDVAGTVEAMRIPNYRLHALKGDRKGYWSVTVKANWRIIFRYEDGNVYNVELIDYH
jgi:proteic killer suppression protein